MKCTSQQKQSELARVCAELKEKDRAGRMRIAYSTRMIADPLNFYTERIRHSSKGIDAYETYLKKVALSGKFDITDDFYHSNIERLLGGRTVWYLDAGCANGTRTRQYMKRLRDYCALGCTRAIDITPEFVENAKKVLGEKNVLQASVLDKIYDNTFDLATCMFGVLGHLDEDELETALENMYTALKKGGVFCFDVIRNDPECLKNFGMTDEDIALGRNHICYAVHDGKDYLMDSKGDLVIGCSRIFTPDEVSHELEKAGFRLIDAIDIKTRPDPTDYAVVCQKG